MNTKVKALLHQIETGKMKTDLVKILNYIMVNEMTSRPLIADGLNMKLQTTVARVSDLLDMGIVEVVDLNEVVSLTYLDYLDYEILQYQSDPIKVAKNAYERKREKFEKWKKRGLNEFSEFFNPEQFELNFDI